MSESTQRNFDIKRLKFLSPLVERTGNFVDNYGKLLPYEDNSGQSNDGTHHHKVSLALLLIHLY